MKAKTKTVAERLSSIVMAGVLATSMMSPAMAFAEDAKPDAGAQTGTGATEMTLVSKIDPNAEYGGTEDPNNPLPITDEADPDYNPDAPGKNLAFTVPSQLNFVLSADGTLTGPTAAQGSFIENRSAMPIHASSLKVVKESGWNIVEDATAVSTANSVDLKVQPAGGTKFDLSTFVSDSKVALAKPSEWNMKATDGINGSGLDTKGFTVGGHATHISANITSAVKFGEIHWYMKGREAVATYGLSSAMDANLKDDGKTFETEHATFTVTDKETGESLTDTPVPAGEEVVVTVTPDDGYEPDDVTVTEADDGTVVDTVPGDAENTVEFEMPDGEIDVEVGTAVVPKYLSFDANGGSGVMATVDMTEGMTAPACTFTAPSGKSFAGWNTAANGSGVGYVVGAVLPVFDDVVLYAQWAKNTATITFKSGARSLGTQTATVGTATTLTAINSLSSPSTYLKPAANNAANSYYGWSLKGWSTSVDTADVDYANRASITVTDDITLYAVYQRTLSFYYYNSSSATTRSSIMRTQTYYNTSDSVASPSALSSNLPSLYDNSVYGWSPLGWYSSSSVAAPSALNEQTVSLTTDSSYTPSVSAYKYFHARYSRIPYVLYSANAGEGSVPESAYASVQYIYCNGSASASSVVLAKNTLTRSGYITGGWSTESSGGTVYANESTFSAFDTSFASNRAITLYAKWVTPTDGDAYAVLDGLGKLTLFRSANTYTTSANATVVDIMGNSYTGRVYSGVETTNSTGTSNSLWYAQRASIRSVDVADNQVVSPVNTAYWYSGCGNLGVCDLDGLNTSNVSNMCHMFNNCYGGNFDIIGTAGWDTSKVTDMSYMFANCSGASFRTPDVSNWNTSSVLDMNHMFNNCRGSSFTVPVVSNWNVYKVTNMSSMFMGCNGSAFSTPDVSKWNTSNVTDMSYLFAGCGCVDFEAPDVSKWNTSKVTNMQGLFQACSGIKFTAPNVSKWDTSNVVNMSEMFYGCSGGAFNAPDVSKWNVSNVIDMSCMFWFCSGAAFTAPDVSNWKTLNVTNMRCMFADCSGDVFGAPDVSKWNVSSLMNMASMFAGCSGSAFTAPDMSNWNTSKVSSMAGMFQNCSGASFAPPELTKWDTSNVRDLSYMFAGCNNSKFTSVDLSHWSLPLLSDTSRMFYGCSNLTTIYVSGGVDWDGLFGLTSSGEMFADCVKLAGGSGTAYDFSIADKTYARVDGLNGQPGYFTAKA